jgi:hypothetical protein
MLKKGKVLLLALAFSLAASAGPIVGAYYQTNSGQAQSTNVFALLSDGRFMFIEDGNPLLDPSGQDGLEKGTYTWNSVTGEFSINTVINTNGEWGLCNVPSGSTLCALPPGVTATATDTGLTFFVPSEGTGTVPRLLDPASPIVGAWYFSSSPAAQDLTVVAFLPNGRVMIGIDPPANGFIEFGGYTWNPLTGALTATIDTSNAPPGSSLNLPSFTSANIANGSLVLSSNSGTLTLSSAAVPEPSSLLLAATGLGVALVLRRRMRRSNV